MNCHPHLSRNCHGRRPRHRHPHPSRGPTLHPTTRSRRLAAATVLALALGACGSGGGEDEVAAETTVPTTRPILTTTLATTTVPDLGGTAYTVQSGDTLGRIAADHGIELARLLEFNGIAADTVLQPGHKLLIPPAEDETASTGTGEEGADGPDLPLGAEIYVIESGDTFNAIAQEFGLSLDELLAANELSADSVLHPGDEIVIPAPPSATGATGEAPTSTVSSTAAAGG